MKKTLTLSVSVPFCPGRCGYCDLKTHAGSSTEFKEAFVRSLIREIDAIAPEMADYSVNSLRFTDGCAALLGASVLRELIAHIKSAFSSDDKLEIAMKSAPTHLNIEILDALARHGRAYIELEQETFDPLLHLSLEQYFTIGAVEDCLNLLRNDSRISFGLRLLYGLQGQGVPSLLASVNSCADADMIVLSPLRISSGTCVEKEYIKCKNEAVNSPRRVFPDREKQLRLYLAGSEHLEKLGFERCTPGHFAKPGKEAQYIINRRLGCDVLGVGPGAESCYDGIYCRNKSGLEDYMAYSHDYIKISEEMKVLSEEKLRAQALVTGLYGRDGLDLEKFQAAYGADALSLLPELSAWQEQGLTESREGRLMLTAEGAFNFEAIRMKLI